MDFDEPLVNDLEYWYGRFKLKFLKDLTNKIQTQFNVDCFQEFQQRSADKSRARYGSNLTVGELKTLMLNKHKLTTKKIVLKKKIFKNKFQRDGNVVNHYRDLSQNDGKAHMRNSQSPKGENSDNPSRAFGSLSRNVNYSFIKKNLNSRPERHIADYQVAKFSPKKRFLHAATPQPPPPATSLCHQISYKDHPTPKIDHSKNSNTGFLSHLPISPDLLSFANKSYYNPVVDQFTKKKNFVWIEPNHTNNDPVKRQFWESVKIKNLRVEWQRKRFWVGVRGMMGKWRFWRGVREFFEGKKLGLGVGV